ncbi:hypothetical protein ACWEAF_34620, partial [Streptomyces sp. NPDC005071]
VPPLDVPPHIHAIHTQPNASPARQTRSPPVVLGVRADLVGGVGEFGGGGLVDAADFEVEDRGEGVAVAAVVEGDLGVYPGAGEPDLAVGGGDAGGAEEAGSPVGGEELLGVGRVAGAAELLGEEARVVSSRLSLDWTWPPLRPSPVTLTTAV